MLTFNVLPKQTIFSTDLTLLPPPSSHDHDETMTTWQPSLTSSLPIGYGNVWLILLIYTVKPVLRGHLWEKVVF